MRLNFIQNFKKKKVIFCFFFFGSFFMIPRGFKNHGTAQIEATNLNTKILTTLESGSPSLISSNYVQNYNQILNEYKIVNPKVMEKSSNSFFAELQRFIGFQLYIRSLKVRFNCFPFLKNQTHFTHIPLCANSLYTSSYDDNVCTTEFLKEFGFKYKAFQHNLKYVLAKRQVQVELTNIQSSFWLNNVLQQIFLYQPANSMGNSFVYSVEDKLTPNQAQVVVLEDRSPEELTAYKLMSMWSRLDYFQECITQENKLSRLFQAYIRDKCLTSSCSGKIRPHFLMYSLYDEVGYGEFIFVAAYSGPIAQNYGASERFDLIADTLDMRYFWELDFPFDEETHGIKDGDYLVPKKLIATNYLNTEIVPNNLSFGFSTPQVYLRNFYPDVKLSSTYLKKISLFELKDLLPQMVQGSNEFIFIPDLSKQDFSTIYNANLFNSTKLYFFDFKYYSAFNTSEDSFLSKSVLPVRLKDNNFAYYLPLAASKEELKILWAKLCQSHPLFSRLGQTASIYSLSLAQLQELNSVYSEKVDIFSLTQANFANRINQINGIFITKRVV